MKTFKQDLSSTYMGTGSLGGIYPVGQVEMLPNDVMQIQSFGVIKFGTLVKDPITALHILPLNIGI